MGTAQAAGWKALQVALVCAVVAAAGYVVLLTVVGFAMQEPDIMMTIKNNSGRPLLVERLAEPRPGADRQSVLVRRRGAWEINRQCEHDRLVARDLQGAVVASRDSACGSDTWIISGQGLQTAPRYQGAPASADRIEVRLFFPADLPDQTLTAWWRALPATLERASAAGQPAGTSVHGPFLEDEALVLYLQGLDAATVVEFAQAQVLRPSPGRVYAYVSAPGKPAPQRGTAVPLEPVTVPTTTAR
ncbi:hypothetical protein [Intrasporangium sp. YIM S08009]|uniref:hypothetical protein n=1 Tax=Intrasporangium zincisolvens TaxID=3080018 RepID=UPI002B059E99|nr:hypothetical protein [Intrasporangium sp. YIM S08009]